MSIEDLVADYIAKRDDLATERKAFETHEAEVKAEMREIEDQIREHCNTLGVDSFKTKAGTAFKTTKPYIHIQDWGAFSRYVLENEQLDLVEKRPSKLRVLELLTEHPALTPDDLGINVVNEVAIQIRK